MVIRMYRTPFYDGDDGGGDGGYVAAGHHIIPIVSIIIINQSVMTLPHFRSGIILNTHLTILSTFLGI